MAVVVVRVEALVVGLAVVAVVLPEVNLSNALVLACTGLEVEGDMAEPLAGEPPLPSSPLSCDEPGPLPACVSAGARRPGSAFVAVPLPAMDKRLLSGLVVVVPRPAVDDVDGCRVTREAGTGGGPMDVRTPAPGRVLVVETTRALFGVLVRDAAVLDAVDPTCFVGDLVGD